MAEVFYMGDRIELEYDTDIGPVVSYQYMITQPDTCQLALINMRSGNRLKEPTHYAWASDRDLTKAWLLDYINHDKDPIHHPLYVKDIHLIKGGMRRDHEEV